jgi:hypothetical protein
LGSVSSTTGSIFDSILNSPFNNGATRCLLALLRVVFNDNGAVAGGDIDEFGDMSTLGSVRSGGGNFTSRFVSPDPTLIGDINGGLPLPVLGDDIDAAAGDGSVGIVDGDVTDVIDGVAGAGVGDGDGDDDDDVGNFRSVPVRTGNGGGPFFFVGVAAPTAVGVVAVAIDCRSSHLDRPVSLIDSSS